MMMTIGDRRTFFPVNYRRLPDQLSVMAGSFWGMEDPVHGFHTPSLTLLHRPYKASFKGLSVKAKTNGLSPVCFEKNT